MVHKEAMSYAKHLWSAKTGTGAHKEIYEAFEKQKAVAAPVETAAVAVEAPAAVEVSASAAVSTPVKAKKQVVQKAPLKAKAAKKEWEAPAPGNVKAWGHEGETYLRDNENRVWHAIQGGEVGAWKGVYNPLTDTIDEAEEPLYEDE
jgi:crotonobetainyl-CoA:carnitine CoA-transferase CaiB-like acyl-CoA transferase